MTNPMIAIQQESTNVQRNLALLIIAIVLILLLFALLTMRAIQHPLHRRP